MKRFVGAALFASFTVVAAGACDDSSGGSYGDYGGGSCSSFTTCGSCTPVSGCGWCFNAAGGMCASDPDSCASVTEFTWTWDPTGCPDVDASVETPDAGATTPAPEASAPAGDASGGSAPEAGALESGTPDAPAEASTADR